MCTRLRTRDNHLAKVRCLFLAMLLGGCRIKTRQLAVQVRDSEGMPVASAAVFLDKVPVGLTDADGRLRAVFPQGGGQARVLEVAPTTSSGLCAPRQQTLYLTNGQENPIGVAVELFCLPASVTSAPSPADVSPAAAPKPLVTQEPPEMEPPPLPAVWGESMPRLGAVPSLTQGSAKVTANLGLNLRDSTGQAVDHAHLYVGWGHNRLYALCQGMGPTGVCTGTVPAAGFVDVFARAAGFGTRRLRLNTADLHLPITLELDRRPRLDLLVLDARFGQLTGVEKVQVKVDQGLQLETDSYGYVSAELGGFSAHDSQRPSGLLSIHPPPSYLPVRPYRVGGGTPSPEVMTLSTRKAPKLRVAVCAAAIAFDEMVQPRQAGVLAALEKLVAARPDMSLIPTTSQERAEWPLVFAHQSPPARVFRSEFDAILVSRLLPIFERHWGLEIVVYGAHAQVLGASFMPVTELSNVASLLDQALVSLGRSLPWQGAIIDGSSGQVNLSLAGYPGLQAGDRFGIWTPEGQRAGLATLQVDGHKVKLVGKPTPLPAYARVERLPAKTTALRVRVRDTSGEPLAGARIYQGSRYLGATDRQGYWPFPEQVASDQPFWVGTPRHYWQRWEGGHVLEVNLAPSGRWVQLQSTPAGRLIQLPGLEVRTPVRVFVPATLGQVHAQVKAEDGFRAETIRETIAHLHKGQIHISSAEDPLATAQLLWLQGKAEAAFDALLSVEGPRARYLAAWLSWQELGDLERAEALIVEALTSLPVSPLREQFQLLEGLLNYKKSPQIGALYELLSKLSQEDPGHDPWHQHVDALIARLPSKSASL